MEDRPLQVCILMGSMRPKGNTAELLKPLMQELMINQAHVMYVSLADKKIAPCDACWTCQNVPVAPGCPKQDDMEQIYRVILNADVLVFATPIYTWYCTPPMKAMLDRLYALSKFYGDAPLGSMLEGKSLALVTTCGYPIEDAARPFEDGMKQYAHHAKMKYLGMLAERDLDDLASFQTPEAIEKAKNFAHVLMAPQKQ